MAASQGELPLDAAPTRPVPSVAPLSPERAEQQLQAAPPMCGAEYLDAEVLQALWTLLDDCVRDQIRHHSSLSALLDEKAPHWHPVGRVCFHLAENKRDPDYPFTFITAYAPDCVLSIE